MATIDGEQAHRFALYAKKSGALFDTVISASKPGKSERVVVLGDGTGEFTERIRGKVKKVLSVDLSNEMVRLLKKRFSNASNVEVVQADMRDTRLKPGFDKVFIVRALHHVREKNKVVSEAFRLLVPGGKLIVADTFFEGGKLARLLFPLTWNLFYRKKLVWDEPAPLFPTEGELKSLLSKAGFAKAKITHSRSNSMGKRFIAVARKDSQ